MWTVGAAPSPGRIFCSSTVGAAAAVAPSPGEVGATPERGGRGAWGVGKIRPVSASALSTPSSRSICSTPSCQRRSRAPPPPTPRSREKARPRRRRTRSPVRLARPSRPRRARRRRCRVGFQLEVTGQGLHPRPPVPSVRPRAPPRLRATPSSCSDSCSLSLASSAARESAPREGRLPCASEARW